MKWDFLRHLRRTVYCGIRSLAFLFSDEEACRAAPRLRVAQTDLGLFVGEGVLGIDVMAMRSGLQGAVTYF